MRPSNPPAILLGGDSNALSAARTLQRLGAPVYAVGGAGSPVRHSRALTEYAMLDVGEGAQERWLAWLVRRRLGGVVIPCADDGVELVARHRAELEAAGYVGPESDDAVALAMLDKERTYELARAQGILCPRTLVPAGLARVQDAADEIGLPCALKPRRTRARMPKGFAAKAFVVHTKEELARLHAALSERGVDVIVTEIVAGSDRSLSQYWSYVTRDGERLLELTKHKVRQHPPSFGTGCYQATGPDPELVEAGRRFVEALGVTGFCSVEFKRRPDDGQLTVIECNYRLVDGNVLGLRGGVDAARVVYERALGRRVPQQPEAPAGLGYWHPVRDLRALPEYRRRGEVSVRGWLKTALGRPVTPYFSLRDPRPSAMVAVNRLRGQVDQRRRPAAGHAGGGA